MRLASPLSFRPLEKICADAPEKKGQTPLCSPCLFGVYGGADNAQHLCRAQSRGSGSSDAAGFSGELKRWARNSKEIIFWSVLWRRSRCRGLCGSPSSCWTSAAGGACSVARMPDRSRQGHPPATFRSSGPFAGGLCCSSRATPFSLACGEAKTSVFLVSSSLLFPTAQNHISTESVPQLCRKAALFVQHISATGKFKVLYIKH